MRGAYSLSKRLTILPSYELTSGLHAHQEVAPFYVGEGEP